MARIQSSPVNVEKMTNFSYRPLKSKACFYPWFIFWWLFLITNRIQFRLTFLNSAWKELSNEVYLPEIFFQLNYSNPGVMSSSLVGERIKLDDERWGWLRKCHCICKKYFAISQHVFSNFVIILMIFFISNTFCKINNGR